MREVSFSKGRILIATENPNKIEGEIQLAVNGRNYRERVEEEDTFRTVTSSNLVSSFEVNSENEEDDAEVDRIDDELDASKINNRKSVDDMESQGNETLVDSAKINKEEAQKVETKCINGSHQSELEKEPAFKEPADFGRSERVKHNENFGCCDNINEVSTNSTHGLDSIVQDSLSPVDEDCVESIQKNIQAQNAESNLDGNNDQEKHIELNVELIKSESSCKTAARI
ncbi:hypothetical protein RHGRI_026952 [Rhododendron griersonianum]|uniref:Uncharacterized protein n=1 Tax=Rhododendron griersonianum TaxID=479676 RepID=A0AAV6IW24_9ERIC|nr:hypothetical protein RHGRI_026952 [Rhododendron griersonianum]